MSEKRKTKAEKNAETIARNRKNLTIKILVFVVILIGIAVSYLYKTTIEDYLNFALNKEPPSTNIATEDLVFHFIDVGQADAILVEFPNDEVMLVDAGQDMSNKSETKDKLFNYLNSNITFQEIDGEKVIDYFVVTHPDFDHIGSADDILDAYKVEKCYRPWAKSKDEDAETKSKSDEYAKYVKAMTEEVDCETMFSAAGIELSIAGVEIKFITPTPDDLEDATSNVNNYSPIMIFSYAGKKVMLTGDAEKEVEENTLANYSSNLSELDIDVLKVGHHGSDTSSTLEFLNALTPKYAIISCGLDNSYGHPKQSTLDNLTTVGVNSNDVYRTDKNGNITLSVSSESEIAVACNYVQYTKIEIKWWYLAVGVGGVSFLIIFLPSLFVKYIIKAQKK